LRGPSRAEIIPWVLKPARLKRVLRKKSPKNLVFELGRIHGCIDHGVAPESSMFARCGGRVSRAPPPERLPRGVVPALIFPAAALGDGSMTHEPLIEATDDVMIERCPGRPWPAPGLRNLIKSGGDGQ